ncbi:ATP-binding protein [Neobacillus mesonae]|uniref:ATP-binding protein n=1 Tax=Neobacillus mesonae TaxID=1193713 RepID=UPI002E1FC473|nr:ATP-binding protein [Neobacillus mesonae]
MEVISGKIEKPKKVVLYGPEGIGKSSLAAQFPNPIFIDTEGSTTELTVDRLKPPSSWTELNQQVDWVKSQVGRFKTLVIDTIDWAEMKCTESVCAQHGKKGVEDFGYGNGYVYVKEELGRFLNKLSDVIEAGIHVVLTAHSQIVKFEQPDEMGSYDRYQLKLGKKTSSQTAPLVKEWADMVLFINYKTFSVAVDDKGKKHKGQGGVRTIYATHHPAWDAKNRHGLPDEFPLDYSNIAHIFNGTHQAPIQAPVQEPVPQVQQPTQVPVQQPAQPVVDTAPPTQPASTNAVELNPMIPKSLRDLMIQNGVSEEEIQVVVSQKGYYPQDTPIANYDPGFIDGVLVAAWPQVFGMVIEFRKTLPF